MFDLICSDLSSYPTARAVAASNGFPILFNPITIENHADQCAGRAPSWIKRFAESKQLTRQHYLNEIAQLYLDPKQTRYVHLMDGGIADNLAMRQLMNYVLIYVDDFDLIRHAGFDRIRRVVLISAEGRQAGTAPGRSSGR